MGQPRLGGLRERGGDEGALLGGLGLGLRRRLGGLREGGGLMRRFGGEDRERGFFCEIGEREGARICCFSGLEEGLVDGLGGCFRGEDERGVRDCAFCGGEGLRVGRLFFLDSIFFLGCWKSEGPFLLRGFLSGLGEPSEEALSALCRGEGLRGFRF